jgi:hypothetical protein
MTHNSQDRRYSTSILPVVLENHSYCLTRLR